MDIYFIPVVYKPKELKNIQNLISLISEKVVGIVYTIQFKEYAKLVISELEKYGISIKIGKSPYIDEPGQVLGCDPLAANIDASIIVYIGEGEFHPFEIKRRFPDKKVIKYSPITGEIKEITIDDRFMKKISILRYKFLQSKRIGIVTTIKPGQYMMREMIKTKEILEKVGKEVYLFIGDIINFDETKNFPYIDFWLVYACPRLIDDILEKGIDGLTINYVQEELIKIKDKEVNSDE